MRKLLLTLTFLLMISTIGLAQDTVKVGINFVNSEYVLNPIDAIEYLQGLSVNLDAKVYSQNENKGFRLAGVFYYKRDNFTSPTDTYAFGPKLSYRVGFVEPFGQVVFGLNTTYNSDKVFSRIYSAGADLNFGYIYVRPIEVGWQRSEAFFSPANQTFSAGLGLRF
jgi:hypothetical protein